MLFPSGMVSRSSVRDVHANKVSASDRALIPLEDRTPNNTAEKSQLDSLVCTTLLNGGRYLVHLQIGFRRAKQSWQQNLEIGKKFEGCFLFQQHFRFGGHSLNFIDDFL